MTLTHVNGNSHAPSRLSRFAWAVVWYTVLIVLWGAWVRISHSGDGCGDQWPLCNGQAVPVGGPVKSWIEVSHRYSTALYGVLVLGLIVAARRQFRPCHPARFWSVATLIFTISEALIGRQLVTLSLVDQSIDPLRLLVMPLHLVNTSALLVSTVMTAESISFRESVRRSLSPGLKRTVRMCALALLVVLCTGAIAALGSHLAPSSSLEAGLAKDFAQDSHAAVRLRLLHPLLALSLVVFGPWAITKWSQHAPNVHAKVWCARLLRTLIVAIAVGGLALLLHAPPWLKILHLLLANVLVIVGAVAVFHTSREVPSSAQPYSQPCDSSFRG